MHPVSQWLVGAWAVLLKDVQLEWRNRFAVNTMLMFVAAVLFVVLFATSAEVLTRGIQSALLWIVILFSAVVGLGRAFISEEEQGTTMLLQLHARPGMIYAGKLLYNFLLILTLNAAAATAFLILTGAAVGNVIQLLVILLLGAAGLSGAITMVAAIIARTSNQGPLIAVLAFPVLVPLLAVVVNATQKALVGADWPEIAEQILALTGYAGVVITASTLLFDYVWHD